MAEKNKTSLEKSDDLESESVKSDAFSMMLKRFRKPAFLRIAQGMSHMLIDTLHGERPLSQLSFFRRMFLLEVPMKEAAWKPHSYYHQDSMSMLSDVPKSSPTVASNKRLSQTLLHLTSSMHLRPKRLLLAKPQHLGPRSSPRMLPDISSHTSPMLSSTPFTTFQSCCGSRPFKSRRLLGLIKQVFRAVVVRTHI